MTHPFLHIFTTGEPAFRFWRIGKFWGIFENKTYSHHRIRDSRKGREETCGRDDRKGRGSEEKKEGRTDVTA